MNLWKIKGFTLSQQKKNILRRRVVKTHFKINKQQIQSQTTLLLITKHPDKLPNKQQSINNKKKTKIF